MTLLVDAMGWKLPFLIPSNVTHLTRGSANSGLPCLHTLPSLTPCLQDHLVSAVADEYHYGMDMNFIHWTYSAILLMVSRVVPQ